MTLISHDLFSISPELRVRDVTLSAHDDFQTQRAKLASIMLDAMYQFVGLLDVEGRMLEINRAALDGIGIQMDDIRGKPFWEARWWVTSPETQNALRGLILRASQGDFVRGDFEVYGQKMGEETIIVDFSLLPIKDSEGNVVFLLPEGRNITEKKRTIKTIGDAYMAAAGLPEPVEDHAVRAAEMALDMIEALRLFNLRTGYNLRMRIGINSGSVVAGVIGKRKFIYDLWGEAVNTASRMESHSLAGRVQVTDATRNLVEEFFLFEERGIIEAKGIGTVHTWFLTGRRQPISR